MCTGYKTKVLKPTLTEPRGPCLYQLNNTGTVSQLSTCFCFSVSNLVTQFEKKKIVIE